VADHSKGTDRVAHNGDRDDDDGSGSVRAAFLERAFEAVERLAEGVAEGHFRCARPITCKVAS
jgi:hypothetical protein